MCLEFSFGYKLYNPEDLIGHLMIDPLSHLTQAVVKLKPEKNSGLNDIRSHDFAIAAQCSTNGAIKPTGSWPHC